MIRFERGRQSNAKGRANSKAANSLQQSSQPASPAGRHPNADRQYFSVSPTPFFSSLLSFYFLCILGRLGLAAILGFHVGRLLFTIYWKRLFVDKVKLFFFWTFFYSAKKFVRPTRWGKTKKRERTRAINEAIFMSVDVG